VNQHLPRKAWYWLRSNSSGEALAGVRRDAGLTQAELSQRLGIDRTTVLNMEAGRNPAINRFVRAFGLFGYDLIAVPRGAHVTVTFEKENE
jgi:transcriptional regulator with XRE-family HTH domain